MIKARIIVTNISSLLFLLTSKRGKSFRLITSTTSASKRSRNAETRINRRKIVLIPRRLSYPDFCVMIHVRPTEKVYDS